MKISCNKNGLSVIMTDDEMTNWELFHHGINTDKLYHVFCPEDMTDFIDIEVGWRGNKWVKKETKNSATWTLRTALSNVNNLPAKYRMPKAQEVLTKYETAYGFRLKLPVDPRIELKRSYDEHYKNALAGAPGTGFATITDVPDGPNGRMTDADAAQQKQDAIDATNKMFPPDHKMTEPELADYDNRRNKAGRKAILEALGPVSIITGLLCTIAAGLYWYF